jgi:hypothetical protein
LLEENQQVSQSQLANFSEPDMTEILVRLPLIHKIADPTKVDKSQHVKFVSNSIFNQLSFDYFFSRTTTAPDKR